MRRVLPALISAAFLAGCGGGGVSSSTTPLPAATPPTSGASTNRTPVGTATLTLKFSPYFHTAKSAIAHKAGSSASRRPAYVNSNSNYLDIWVISQGNPIHVVSTYDSAPNVMSTFDGSQTLSIPLYSTASSQIVAYERDQPYDSSNGNLLSVGEADITAFTPGTAPQIALTMSMNARYLGVMSDPDDANGDATVASPYAPFTCNSNLPLYFFAADADQGFVDLAGAGGVALPVVTSWTSQATNPSDTLTQASGVDGAYSGNFYNSSTTLGLAINLSASNPAYPLAYDFYYGQGSYPGIDYLASSYNDYYFTQDMYGIFYSGASLTNQMVVLDTESAC